MTAQQRTIDEHTPFALRAELMAFRQVLANLERCLEESDKDFSNDPVAAVERRVRLCGAVNQNTRLWMTILDEVMDASNQLAPQLKSRLALLGKTSVGYGPQVLMGKATARLLIDINTATTIGFDQVQESALMPSTSTAKAPDRQHSGTKRSASTDLETNAPREPTRAVSPFRRVELVQKHRQTLSDCAARPRTAERDRHGSLDGRWDAKLAELLTSQRAQVWARHQQLEDAYSACMLAPATRVAAVAPASRLLTRSLAMSLALWFGASRAGCAIGAIVGAGALVLF